MTARRTTPPFPRGVVVLGATGSIGGKALAVVERYAERFSVRALSSYRSISTLAEGAGRFGVPRVALGDPDLVGDLEPLLPAGCSVGAGAKAIADLAGGKDVDLVVNGIMGRAGLEASLQAARAGKMLALANKESLVLAGELLMRTAEENSGLILPVDSEHSGLYQCLEGKNLADIRRLIITASGGPFRTWTPEALADVTPEQALRHPVWPMGPRITVDSATLFNKGLEVIETHHLFGVPLDRIEVWVHPQSVVHALVEMNDGSLLAQLSAPDMMIPVQYAMSYPERWECDAPDCRLPDWKGLVFEEPDHRAFPALKLAYEAAEKGGTAPAVLNAADEVAVEAFLERRLPLPGVVRVVEEVLGRVAIGPADSLPAVVEADRKAREAARKIVATRRR